MRLYISKGFKSIWFVFVVTFLTGSFLFFYQEKIIQNYEKYSPAMESLPNNTKVSSNWEDVIRQRNIRVKETCQKYPFLVNYSFQDKATFWEKASLLAYCRIPKASSGSWVSMLFLISHNESLFRQFRNSSFFEKPTSGEEDFIPFTTCRHPLTRLLSAFRNKIRTTRFENLAKYIVQRYRKEIEPNVLTTWKNLTHIIIDIDAEKYPTIYEFLLYIMDATEKCLDSNDIVGCFLNINEHFRPCYFICNPCINNFSIITKVETTDQDYRYVIQKSLEAVSKVILREAKNEGKNFIGAPDSNAKWGTEFLENETKSIILMNHERIKYLLSHFQMHDRNKSKGPSTSTLLRKAMSVLPEDMKERLRHVLRFEFELYGYDPFEFELEE